MVAKGTPATRCASAVALQHRPISEKSMLLSNPQHFALQGTSAYGFYASRQWRCSAHRQAAECPLWVKSRHRDSSNQCPLCLQKRTLELSRGMSALCQKADILHCSEKCRKSITSASGVGRQAVQRCTSRLRRTIGPYVRSPQMKRLGASSESWFDWRRRYSELCHTHRVLKVFHRFCR